MKLRTLEGVEVKGKRVILRVDFNTPLNDRGLVQNNKRIRAALPTIMHLKNNGARIIILTHLGRPKGQYIEKYDTQRIANELSEMLNEHVQYVEHVSGERAEAVVSEMKDGEMIMLENARFYPEEKQNNPDFAQSIARLGDIYVNDGFGVSHRDHASITGIPKYLPSYAGFLVENEINTLTKVRDNPEKPLLVIMGGVKLETRIPMIEQFIEKADYILFGGAMIFTFFKAQGLDVGKSLVDDEQISTARELLEKYAEKLILPVDVVVAKDFAENAPHKTVSVDNIPADEIGLDVGQKTVELFSEKCKNAKTIIWNGPLGAFETKPFDVGTFKFAQAISKVSAQTIIGGGDTAAAVEEAGLQDKMTFISTGGGASLTLLEGKKLPGIEALTE